MSGLWIATAEELNKIINDPSVRSALDDTSEYIDTNRFLSVPGYIALTDGYRASIHAEHEPGAYLCHIFCLEGYRGKEALSFGRRACKLMFNLGAHLLVCEIPVKHWTTRSYAKRLGFLPVATCYDGGVEHSIYHMREENLI